LCWKPLQQGQIKPNFDASMQSGYGTGLEVVFRNDKGKVMAATTYFEMYLK